MLKDIKEQLYNNPFLSKSIPIVLSVWILSLTAYYCINAPWHIFFSVGRSDTKELITETLNFHWIPVFLSRLPYVFYALILNFIAMLTGNRFLRWLKVDIDSNINKIIFSIPLGWSIYSIVIFYLGISGLLYKEAVYSVIALLGIISIFEIKRFIREWNAVSATSIYKIDKTDLIFLPVIIIFLSVQLVTSFSPVWTNDVLVYHMALPKLYIKHHALVHVPGFFHSTSPAHTEVLYLLGLITSGETLSKLFSFSISLIFLFLIFSIGNKYFSKGAGYLAVIIIMQVSPFFTPYFSEPWTDTALGLFSLSGIYAFFIWIEGLSSNEVKERKDGYLYLSIICCALAAATKLHGLLIVLLFFAGFFATVKRDRYFQMKLTWCFIAVCIIALPWYIRSWWLTGDPVFPFLYDYLGARHWNKYSNESLLAYRSEWRGAQSFSDFIRINKDLFSSGLNFSSLSPVISIFLIPALIMLGVKSKHVSLKASTTSTFSGIFPCLLLAILPLAYYIFFVFTSPQIRHFFACYAIIIIIVAHFIKTVWTIYPLIRIPIILCIVTFFIPFFSLYSGIAQAPFFAGLGVLNKKQFLDESPYRYLRESSRVATWVNENLPQNSKLLTWLSYGYLLDREYVPVNPAFQGVLDFSRINDTQTFLKSIKELGITHLIFCNTDITSPRGHAREFLDKCISELRENYQITPIKQIGSCTIYSTSVPQGYFMLDDKCIKFYDESQRKHLVKGWSSTEEWGTWSEGKESLIILNFNKQKDYTMLIKATGFSVPDKQQSVRIYLDNNLLGEHTFTHPTTYFEDIEMKIPSEYIMEGNQQIRFVYGFTGSPEEYEMGSDTRQLAMGVSSIEFR